MVKINGEYLNPNDTDIIIDWEYMNNDLKKFGFSDYSIDFSDVEFEDFIRLMAFIRRRNKLAKR